ncbi:MAG TPA: hypothetical protein VGR43_11550 [Dehalococcoidia bacterium]|nr:hypothetical protein [Dehalococcoidia bacterium]
MVVLSVRAGLATFLVGVLATVVYAVFIFVVPRGDPAVRGRPCAGRITDGFIDVAGTIIAGALIAQGIVVCRVIASIVTARAIIGRAIIARGIVVCRVIASIVTARAIIGRAIIGGAIIGRAVIAGSVVTLIVVGVRVVIVTVGAILLIAGRATVVDPVAILIVAGRDVVVRGRSSSGGVARRFAIIAGAIVTSAVIRVRTAFITVRVAIEAVVARTAVGGWDLTLVCRWDDVIAGGVRWRVGRSRVI